MSWMKSEEGSLQTWKVDSLWMGSYVIHDIDGANSFHLSDMGGEKQTLPVNGQLLKLFFSDNI